MITRTAFAQLGYSPVTLVATLLMLGLTYVAPPLLLLSADPLAITLGGGAWLVMSIAFVPLLRAHRTSSVLAVMLPLIALFYTAATIASAVLFWNGCGGYWKGRFQAVAPPMTPRPDLAKPHAAQTALEHCLTCDCTVGRTEVPSHPNQRSVCPHFGLGAFDDREMARYGLRPSGRRAG